MLCRLHTDAASSNVSVTDLCNSPSAAHLVSLLDALANVVAGEGALQRPAPNQLGVCGPAAQLQGHIVHIDELEA